MPPKLSCTAFADFFVLHFVLFATPRRSSVITCMFIYLLTERRHGVMIARWELQTCRGHITLILRLCHRVFVPYLFVMFISLCRYLFLRTGLLKHLLSYIDCFCCLFYTAIYIIYIIVTNIGIAINGLRKLKGKLIVYWKGENDKSGRRVVKRDNPYSNTRGGEVNT